MSEVTSIVALVDEGIKKEIEFETEIWNGRLFAEEYKGTEHDRFPLSPSQIGKCGLALARSLSHYLGSGDYPRNSDDTSPRLKRIFARGDLLEGAILDNIEKYSPFKITERQKRVRLFSLSETHTVGGNIDGVAVHEDGTRILIDIKSKGARYSANFNDSIDQFFAQMRETGLVDEFAPGGYFITDPKGLFDIISMDEFFVDYLLQLNAYAFSPDLEAVDFVSLFYENKNTCANYEVRWKPSPNLFEYAKDKFEYIYNTVVAEGAETVPKEFNLGSARCRFCEHNARCWGAYTPKDRRNVGSLPQELEHDLRVGIAAKTVASKTEEEVLHYMEMKGLTHVVTGEGLTYERKYYNPKSGPYYSLKLSR